MDELLNLLRKPKSFNELSSQLNLSKKELKYHLQFLMRKGRIEFKQGKYHLINKSQTKVMSKPLTISLNKKYLVMFALATLLFIPTFMIINYSSEYLAGFRDNFMNSFKYMDDFSVYSNDEMFFNSPLLNFWVIDVFYKLVPWSMIRGVSVIVFYLLSMLNVYLLYDLFKTKKYSFILVPVFYFIVPAIEYSNLLLVTFLILAFKYWKKPYVSAVFLSLSLLTKTYALVAVLIIVAYRLFSKRFLEMSFKMDDFRLALNQLIIITLIQLIIYWPYGYQSLIQRLFTDTFNEGFNFFNLKFVFLFPMFGLMIMTIHSAIKRKDNKLFLIFIFYLAMYYAQSKIGANIYYSIIPPIMLYQYYKQSIDKNYLYLMIGFAFAAAFFGLHSNFILLGSNQELFFDQYQQIPNNTLFFTLHGIHPLLFKQSTFETLVPYKPGLNISSYDSLFFNLHITPKDYYINTSTLALNYNTILMGVFNGCVYCKQTTFYFNQNKTLWYDLQKFYADHAETMCGLSAYQSMILFTNYKINYKCTNNIDLLSISHFTWIITQFLGPILTVIILVLYFLDVRIKSEA